MKKLLLLSVSLAWAFILHAQSGTWVVYNTSNSDLPADKIESLGFEGSDVWVGTYNGGTANYDGSDWTVYNSTNSDLPIDRVLSIAINGGDRWFGTTWGLANLDATDTWTVYHTGDGLPHEYVTALKFDGSDDLLIGTGGGGLAKYDIDGDTWTTLLSGQNVTDIDIDSDGDLWVTTYANGVYYLKPDGTELGHYTSSNSDLPHNRVLSIAIDGSDNKWIGCHWLGVGKLADDNSTWTLYKVSNSDLPDNKVNSIDVDTNEDVWFATDGGLAVFDGSDWTIYDTGTSTMPSDLVEVIRITSGGDEWAGTWGGGLAEHDILNNDLGITAISAPASGVGLTATEDVTVTITNFGNNSQAGFDVSYSIDGGAATTETVAGPIAAGATLDYTFTAQADLSGYATYSIEASTELVGDEDNSNDPETVSVTNTPPASTFTGSSQDGYDIDLTWDAWVGSAIDNFKIYRDGVEIATPGSGSTDYTDSDGFTPGTTYEYYITVIKGSLESASSDDTLSVTYQYHTCTPDLSAVTDEHIDDVTFGGIENENTGTYVSGTEGYSDYTDIYAEFIRDETYTLEVTFEDNTSPNSDPYGIWVDWNGNGVFEEASDTTITGNLNFAPGTTEITKSHDLTVPAGASSTALLRIMHINSGTVDPCLIQNVVGEVEDYTLTLFDAPASTYYDFDGGNPADPTYTIYFQL